MPSIGQLLTTLLLFEAAPEEAVGVVYFLTSTLSPQFGQLKHGEPSATAATADTVAESLKFKQRYCNLSLSHL